jgi:hypothetical protein
MGPARTVTSFLAVAVSPDVETGPAADIGQAWATIALHSCPMASPIDGSC